MNGRGRIRGAFGLMCVLAGEAAAGPASELTLVSSEWSDAVLLPSATASETSDEQFRLASVCQEAYDDEATACEASNVSLCCPTQSLGTASVGAVFLHRSRPDSSAIVTPPTGTPGTVINANDFGFGWDAGPDVTLARRTERGLLVEGRYFNDRNADAEFGIPSITTFRTAGIGVTILGSGPINGFYQTKLDSSELNVHAPIHPRVTLLGGFRWVELHDTLRLNIATPATFVNWDDNNHMYGGQLGTNIAFTKPTNPLRMNLALKAGVYGNDMDNRFTSTIVSGANSSDVTTSFIGELNFTAAYQLTRHMALRGGYEVLWLDNVALAGDAAAATTQIPGGTSSPVPNDGRLWYNGATAGVEFLW
jgi:hypothetical protein